MQEHPDGREHLTAFLSQKTLAESEEGGPPAWPSPLTPTSCPHHIHGHVRPWPSQPLSTSCSTLVQRLLAGGRNRMTDRERQKKTKSTVRTMADAECALSIGGPVSFQCLLRVLQVHFSPARGLGCNSLPLVTSSNQSSKGAVSLSHALGADPSLPANSQGPIFLSDLLRQLLPIVSGQFPPSQSK